MTGTPLRAHGEPRATDFESVSALQESPWLHHSQEQNRPKFPSVSCKSIFIMQQSTCINPFTGIPCPPRALFEFVLLLQITRNLVAGRKPNSRLRFHVGNKLVQM